MKNQRLSFYAFMLLLLFFTSCTPTVKDELLPVLTTTDVTAITQTTAISGGNITSDGGSSVTARGVCWSTKPTPTIADSKTTDRGGIGAFTSFISGLTASTTYFVRAYATTSTGTGYGSAYQITTLVTPPTTVIDADGNVYNTITIGTQTWMAENLKTTKYKDGTAIPVVTDNTAWSSLSTGACCNYNNDAANATKYGKLYNWYAVNKGKLAPAGWHIPTDAEWTILTNYVTANLGTSLNVAKALAATTDWISDNTTGFIGCNLTLNNSTGFSALAGGARYGIGMFDFVGNYAYWWSSSEYNAAYAWGAYMRCYGSSVAKGGTIETDGLSVRCVWDTQ